MANLLFLLPMPLTPSQKKKLIDYLNIALLTYTLDEIVEQELDLIYSWPTMPNSKTKQLYKNYALVYSRTELKNLLLLTYTEALGTTPPDPAENDVPIAEDDTIETLINTPISGELSNSDTPSEDGGNVWSLVTDAVNGVVVLNPDGSYTYTPNADFIGTDSFEYQLCDADGDCSTATITIAVTADSPMPVDNVPIAVGDANETTMDTPVSGDLSLNDTPSADGGNEWSLVENASDGTVMLNADGAYTYTPGAGFEGVDSFTYQVCDADGDCSTATVTITVTSNPETPIDSTEDPTDTWNPPILLDPSDMENLPNEVTDEMAELNAEMEAALEETLEKLDTGQAQAEKEMQELADRYPQEVTGKEMTEEIALGIGKDGWTPALTNEEKAERQMIIEMAQEASEEAREASEATINEIIDGIQEIMDGMFGLETGDSGDEDSSGGGSGGGDFSFDFSIDLGFDFSFDFGDDYDATDASS